MLMCVFLFLLWLIFNGRITLEICLFGIVVTGLVYAFCVAVLGYHPRNERRVLRRLGWYLQYGATLVWEIVKANVQTMKVILSPKAAYRPAVVRLQVPLEEASSRVLLSNSITLTPGTVTIRQQEEEFLVLCLDKDGGEAIPDWNLVRILKKLIAQCYHYLFWGALVFLGLGLLAVMVYIIRARLTSDRIIGINLVGTIVVMVIVVLTFLLGEDYLADIALIYVVLSFIAVMMLCRIYINLYQRNQRKKEEASHDR